MCLTYESVYSFAEERTVTAELVPLAGEYERVHFIGHALYNPSISEEGLRFQGASIQAQLQSRTGYKVFLVDIMVKQYPPFMTDVDFVIDVPVESPVAPLVLWVILAALAAILAFIVWLFWTTWIQEEKLYYCDQHPDMGPWSGKQEYAAHLAQYDPLKYEAWTEAKAKNWWEEFPEMVKWIVGGAVAVAAVTLVIALVRRGGE